MFNHVRPTERRVEICIAFSREGASGFSWISKNFVSYNFRIVSFLFISISFYIRGYRKLKILEEGETNRRMLDELKLVIGFVKVCRKGMELSGGGRGR